MVPERRLILMRAFPRFDGNGCHDGKKESGKEVPDPPLSGGNRTRQRCGRSARPVLGKGYHRHRSAYDGGERKVDGRSIKSGGERFYDEGSYRHSKEGYEPIGLG